MLVSVLVGTVEGLPPVVPVPWTVVTGGAVVTGAVAVPAAPAPVAAPVPCKLPGPLVVESLSHAAATTMTEKVKTVKTATDRIMTSSWRDSSDKTSSIERPRAIALGVCRTVVAWCSLPIQEETCRAATRTQYTMVVP
jgi:hypothetical protein